jgi:hypothetical protein
MNGIIVIISAILVILMLWCSGNSVPRKKTKTQSGRGPDYVTSRNLSHVTVQDFFLVVNTVVFL